MPEEVKIRVVQESQGTALDDAKKDLQELKQEAAKPTPATAAPMVAPAPAAAAATAAAAPSDRATRMQAVRARIEELNRLEKTYADKGMPEAAASTRTERIPHARELRDLQREQRAADRSAADSARERAASRAAEAAAVEKARRVKEDVGSLADRRSDYLDGLKAKEMRAAGDTKGAAVMERQVSIRQRAVQLERELALTKGEATKLAEREYDVTRKSTGLLSGAALTRGIGAAVTAGLGFVKHLIDDRLEASRRSAAIAAEGMETGNRTAQIAGIGGVRGEGLASGNFQQQRNELENLKNKRGTFASQAPTGYMDMFKAGMKERFGKTSLFGIEMETDADRGERENNEKIVEKATALQLAKKQAQQKFKTGTGLKEIEAAEARSKGDMNKARAIEDALTRKREHDRLMELSGNDEKLSSRGADAKLANIRRERAGQFGRFINSSTSAAASARIATMAAAQSGMGRDEKTGELIQVVKAQHQEATNAWRFRDFTRR